VRLRVPVREAELRALEGWPPLEAEPLGEWVLRASAGFSARGCSALLLGDPGLPWEQAVERLLAFYGDRSLPAWVQSVNGSPEQARLVAEGWDTARPGEADTSFRIASLTRAVRAVRARLPADPPAVRLEDRVSEAWLADDARAQAHRRAAVAVLEGPRDVAFASVTGPDGGVVAKGRASLSERADVWVGITDVWVSPDHRRGGLAAAVLGALLGWAAERAATSAYLQVRMDNTPGLALYERLGFAEHHSYRYLRLSGR
jgi:ribosomal protein S18 acetylase RimI-like enzyme